MCFHPLLHNFFSSRPSGSGPGTLRISNPFESFRVIKGPYYGIEDQSILQSVRFMCVCVCVCGMAQINLLNIVGVQSRKKYYNIVFILL
jgi:hypothetical protein